jgi:multisubunit Na+/H+ antiporter MnhB subunit
MSEPRPAIRRLRERKERHQQRSRLFRIAFGTVAVLIVLAGLTLSLPGVPGPGLVLIGVGLAMLALEFERAERLLERILDRLETAREKTSPVVQVALATAGIVAAIGAIVAVVLWEIPVLPG